MKRITVNAGTATIRNPIKPTLELSCGEGFVDLSINVISTYRQEKGVQTLQDSRLDGRADIKLYLPLTNPPAGLVADYQGLSVGLSIEGNDVFYFPLCQIDSVVDGKYVFIVQTTQGNGLDSAYKNFTTLITEENSE